jgi:hypothetical protein
MRQSSASQPNLGANTFQADHGLIPIVKVRAKSETVFLALSTVLDLPR